MKNFKILLPYRIKGMNTDEQTRLIKQTIAFVQYACSALVNDLLETDILDENGTVVEHVYALACYGHPNNSLLRKAFPSETTDSEGIVLFS